MAKKYVYVILWNEKESAEYGELQVVAASHAAAVRWCEGEEYDYTDDPDNEEATVLIKKEELY